MASKQKPKASKSDLIVPPPQDDNEEEDEKEYNDENDDFDDDESPDYEQTNSRTPSPSTRVVASDRWRAFQAFERQQRAIQAPVAPTPIDLAAIIAATITAVAAATAPTLQAASPVVDSHGRQHTSKLDIALHAPVHGAWDDVDYLANTYMPLYDKYRSSCGSHNFDTVWECYSRKQRECISKFLTTHDSKGIIVDDYSVDILSRLSNEDFTTLMFKTKGYSTSMITEIELRKLPAIRLPLTTRSHWVDFESNWISCLKKASKQGALDTKRLTVIYRESIPDPFIQLNLLQQNFKTWEQCHAHMLLQINSHLFLVPWGIDKEERKARNPQDPKGRNQGGSAQHQGGGAQHQAAAHSIKAAAHSIKAPNPKQLRQRTASSTRSSTRTPTARQTSTLTSSST